MFVLFVGYSAFAAKYASEFRSWTCIDSQLCWLSGLINPPSQERGNDSNLPSDDFRRFSRIDRSPFSAPQPLGCSGVTIWDCIHTMCTAFCHRDTWQRIGSHHFACDSDFIASFSRNVSGSGLQTCGRDELTPFPRKWHLWGAWQCERWVPRSNEVSHNARGFYGERDAEVYGLSEAAVVNRCWTPSNGWEWTEARAPFFQYGFCVDGHFPGTCARRPPAHGYAIKWKSLCLWKMIDVLPWFDVCGETLEQLKYFPTNISMVLVTQFCT